ncbi:MULTISPECIES: response regulator [Methylocaldum]|jgi:DNA-binding NtrC family response regulator|uniref:response regulator n=1 Tax=unclassified Methylocaldum TaxID=2622260 RepID=UPI00098B01A2|nr:MULTISPECIES: response regulator [unclassified Methylocaldum]MBP1148637.1 DNA-binding NtrC family response regulator [Methylocaldum sp. RMAD-M]MVF20080.1 response regulator [Methylocaldum sp. BRCS4]
MQIGVDTERAVDNRRVFVVDSDEITSAALQFMLHDEIETHELSSLDAAYAKAKDWKPDVLLLGIGIVQEKGIEVLADIRSKIADLKIILVADSATDPLAKECLKNGVNSILPKPLTIEKTRQKVDAQLGRKVKLSIPVQVV